MCTRVSELNKIFDRFKAFKKLSGTKNQLNYNFSKVLRGIHYDIREENQLVQFKLFWYV